jgi:hypothetical protein
MGGVTGFGGVRSSGWRVFSGHKKARTRRADLSGGSVCYGCMASITTINAYKIGSATSAPAMAFSISSLVMLKFKTFIRGTCRAEHFVCGE